ncbi:hypothetical protein P8452_58192 [Trifolium repens]|nr:hypothetical protein P8452_58192 [Trifolium repens]
MSSFFLRCLLHCLRLAIVVLSQKQTNNSTSCTDSFRRTLILPSPFFNSLISTTQNPNSLFSPNFSPEFLHLIVCLG